jgi:Fur family ferric uptake transcriptional regulator
MATHKTLRDTRQRRTILEELKKLKTHPTADELYEIVRKQIPRISLGTVYRNLDILADSGMILRLEHGAGCYRFDGNPENHYHVRCSICGRVDDISDAPLEDIEQAIQEKCGYEILTHRLEFIGICPDCQKKEKT